MSQLRYSVLANHMACHTIKEKKKHFLHQTMKFQNQPNNMNLQTQAVVFAFTG